MAYKNGEYFSSLWDESHDQRRTYADQFEAVCDSLAREFGGFTGQENAYILAGGQTEP